ncbi:MAG: hypothetical protein NVSMB52_17960 [Chloroflexota bacterium]
MKRKRHEDQDVRRSGWLGLLLVVLWWLLGLLQLRRLGPLRGRGDDESSEVAGEGTPGCQRVPADVYRRPDPMIYSQSYLMSQGLAVTWDNPDIHLERSGIPVPSSELLANTEYEVVARIWNGSNQAPAVNLPIRFSYLSFGIGTVSHLLNENGPNETRVDLPVNGAVGHPAIARIPWKTPATPGHYCLQVEALWADDANPRNNLGQENTDVKSLNSPHASFTFPVRNNNLWAGTLRLEMDAYEIPERRRCDPRQIADVPTMSEQEVAEHRRDALAHHSRQTHPVPDGWEVVVEPRELRLQPGEQHDVTVDINAPDGFVGRQALNVNGFDGLQLVGGVTLYVDGSGT